MQPFGCRVSGSHPSPKYEFIAVRALCKPSADSTGKKSPEELPPATFSFLAPRRAPQRGNAAQRKGDPGLSRHYSGTTPGCGAARRCEAETLPGMAGRAHSIPGAHSFGATRRRTAIPRAGWGQPGEGALLTIVSRLDITAGGVPRFPRRYRRKVSAAGPPPRRRPTKFGQRAQGWANLRRPSPEAGSRAAYLSLDFHTPL